MPGFWTLVNIIILALLFLRILLFRFWQIYSDFRCHILLHPPPRPAVDPVEQTRPICSQEAAYFPSLQKMEALAMGRRDYDSGAGGSGGVNNTGGVEDAGGGVE